MMKKLILMFCCILLTCSLMSSALAEMQEDFELSCREKTVSDAIVYTSSEEDRAPVDSIPAGTYVQVLDVSSGGWTEIVYMLDGVMLSGWTDAVLDSCEETLCDEYGFEYIVHENDPDYEKIIDILADDLMIR